MRWFFVVVLLVAIALFIVRAAEQGQALAAAMVFTATFAITTALISACCFVVAFLFGAMERAMAKDQDQVGSPFIDGSPPEQILPPKPTDSN